MLPRAKKDLHALELGFLADAVLRGMSQIKDHQPLTERGALTNAATLLRTISEGVGSWSGEHTSASPLSALTSFSYAAEALRLSEIPRLSDNLRTHFGALATQLDQMANGQSVDSGEVAALESFFEGLSDATLDNWNASQSPTLMGA